MRLVIADTGPIQYPILIGHTDILPWLFERVDDRKGVLAAERQGLNVTGTLRVLDLAAEHTLIDFALAVSALKLTTFRMPLALLGELLNKHKGPEEPEWPRN